jgi:hypothetical protein
LVHDSENARRLRQSTPFAGILTQEERRRILEPVNLRDVAAGWLLVECSGGRVTVKPSPLDQKKIAIVAWNGKIDLNESETATPNKA